MTNNLDTLATALYARIDDELKASPWLLPARPVVGIAPRLSDAELLTLAVMSALLGYISERRWLRRAGRDFRHLFPYLPGQSGYNKRLRSAFSVLFALTGAKADERETLRDMLDTAPDVVAAHPDQTIIGDKNYYGREFESDLTERHLNLLRPARKGEPERAGAHLFKPLRQVIESINQTFKGQLDLERHGGKSPAGVVVRVLSRILALTAAIWHNDKTGQPVKRSLIAYDY